MAADGRVWVKNGHVIMRGGEVFLYPSCPCDCDPKTIASKTLNNESENPEDRKWNLKPYKHHELGTPNAQWRIIETGEDRYTKINSSGSFDECGYPTGLPDEVSSHYSYDYHLELQQGCEDEDGNMQWPDLPDEY